MYDPLFTRKFFTDASLINVQLVSMRGVGIVKRTIYKNISNYKTIYKRIGVTLCDNMYVQFILIFTNFKNEDKYLYIVQSSSPRYKRLFVSLSTRPYSLAEILSS